MKNITVVETEKNTKKNKSNNNKIENIKSEADYPTERKIREKIELNNLLKNLNYIEEDEEQEQIDINFEIPYFLTKEWVIKNLLS